jgi:hypothetical protein
MKKILGMSLIAASVTMAGASSTTAEEIAHLQKQIDRLKVKLGKVNAQSANDNIKWGVDFRTAIDSINYDMADGRSMSKNDLMSMRLWLNMAYAPDSHNVFKGQLSMNKAFGADFADPFNTPGGNRTFSMGGLFDWTTNEALTDDTLKVRQAYWLYLGDRAFGLDMPWTFSIGRRPSTNGFLSNLRDDDPAQSPLGHIINVEFDGLSSKLDLSNVTGITGMSFKICMGQGATNAQPLFATATPYANDADQLSDVKLAGFIFEPYNDGQIITKATWFRAYDLPGLAMDMQTGESLGFRQYGDIEGGAFSVLIDGLTEDGYFADAKVFGSVAYSKTRPDDGKSMLGSSDNETGTSYWFGTQLPVTDEGKLGLEYNHGSQYWRPFDYAEDTMIGSKLAARGDAWEAYFTYQLTDALSAQIRYTKIDYDYTGSNGFFGNTTGAAMKIDDVKAGAKAWSQLGGTSNPASAATVVGNLMASGMNQQQAMTAAKQMGMAAAYLPNIVESAQDLRFYIRYRF